MRRCSRCVTHTHISSLVTPAHCRTFCWCPVLSAVLQRKYGPRLADDVDPCQRNQVNSKERWGGDHGVVCMIEFVSMEQLPAACLVVGWSCFFGVGVVWFWRASSYIEVAKRDHPSWTGTFWRGLVKTDVDIICNVSRRMSRVGSTISRVPEPTTRNYEPSKLNIFFSFITWQKS